MTTELGRIEHIDAREVWPHEAHDLTPWLLDNAEILGEVLRLDIELNEAEHPVGSFSLDLVVVVFGVVSVVQYFWWCSLDGVCWLVFGVRRMVPRCFGCV